MNKRKEIFRQQVLKAAREIFKTKGYSKTTMEDIARALDKGKSTIYYYFKSKEDIFKALIDQSINKLQDELMSVIRSKGDIKTLLKRYIIKRMEYSNQIATFYNQVKNEYMSIYNLIQKYRKSLDEFEILAIKNLLIRGMENNEIRISEKDIEPAAYAIASAIKGLEIPFFVENKYTYFKNRLDSLLDLLFYGLLTKCDDQNQQEST
jgi:AcrR family transcriptional regulator